MQFIFLLILSFGLPLLCVAENQPILLPLITVTAPQSENNPVVLDWSRTPDIESPLSATRISTQDLADRQAQNIADLADYSPGVSRRSNYWGVDTPTFQLRGFNAGESTAYYKDGFRYQGRAPFSLANVEAVEILRGPQSAIYGWSEPGGLVQVLTKQPTAQTIRNVSWQGDVWGRTLTTIDLGGALSEESRFRWITAHEQRGGFRDGARGEQFFLAPSLAVDFTEGRRLQLSLEWLDDRRRTDYGIPAQNGRPADIPPDRNYGEEWGSQHSQALRMAARWKQNAWGGDLSLAYSYYQLKYLEYRDVEPYAVSGSTIKRWYESYPEQYRWATVYADWSRSFGLREQVHRLSSRLEFALESRSLYGGVWDDYTSIDIANPIYRQPWTPSSDYSVYDQAWRNRSIGLALQDEITHGNWNWLAGVRLSYLRQTFDYADYLPVPGEVHQSQANRSINPRLGVSWRVMPTVALYANYAAGAAATLPQSRGFTGDAFSPINSQQYETGIKWQPANGDWLSSLALFRIHRNNVLTRDPDHPNYSIQTGVQQARGIEWQWQGKLAPLWRLTAQMSWLQAVIVQDNRYQQGNLLPYAPRLSASAWLSRQFLSEGTGRWSTSAGVVHQGRRHADFANTVEIPAYTRFDLGASYRERLWAATLTVENLADRRYYASGVENRPAVIYPGQPRTLMLRLSYDFR